MDKKTDCWSVGDDMKPGSGLQGVATRRYGYKVVGEVFKHSL